MNLREKYGKTALVAGASEGIGEAFSHALAAQGIDLILVARRPGPLEQLADDLRNKHRVNVTCITCDLSAEDATDRLLKSLNGYEPDIIVYNAALSFIGPFTKTALNDYNAASNVNMMTPLRIAYIFGEKMVQKGRGAIILMTSMAGLQGSGFLTVYASTKAFGRILAESLWYEWKEKGVDVIACCAGATATPGYLNTNPGKTSLLTPRVLRPDEIPAECFRKLGRQPSFIPGRGNRIASFFMQNILPRKMAVKIMGDNTRKMYRL